MRRIIFFLIIFIGLLPVSICGETISQRQAQEMARQFFNASAGRVVAPPKLVYNGRRLTTNRLFTPFYVYNNSTGGFVIISADNKAFPILGFSLKDNFDPDLMGESEKALLASYAREIELIRYDSNYVDNTEETWTHYPEYVNMILSSRYEATDPTITIEEADQILDYSIEDDTAIFSDIYTPEQWQEMILEELKVKSSVPLWLINGDNVYPAIVYGRQGDYFRIEMSRRNSWLMRLNATEIISSNMVSTVLSPIAIPQEVADDTPFLDYDTFAEEVKNEELERKNVSHADIIVKETTPRLLPGGGAHYQIVLPDNIALIRVYDLSGTLVRRFTIGEVPMANIDLSAETPGFYIINAIDNNGRSYGFKVYR